MTEDEAIEVARGIVACDNARDLEGYRALLWDDYHAEVNGAEGVTSGDAEADSLARYWRGFSDGYAAEELVVASGNIVTMRYRLTGTNDGEMEGRPATGRKIDVAGCTIFEVEEGRVRRVFRYLDVFTWLGQLGMLPADDT
ncbi:MAG: ester cyclase [bacterium]|nr:ester cyclase [bacterium]